MTISASDSSTSPRPPWVFPTTALGLEGLADDVVAYALACAAARPADFSRQRCQEAADRRLEEPEIEEEIVAMSALPATIAPLQHPIVCSWARARVLMAKIIARRHGVLDEVAYNNARMLRFTRREYASLDEFAAALRQAAALPFCCLIRGELCPHLDPKSWYRRLSKPENPEHTLDGPDRSWGVFDFDGALVPELPSFRERLLFLRDRRLPTPFSGKRLVATATSHTGLRRDIYARLYFQLVAPVPNRVLEDYADGLGKRHPDLRLDPSVHRTGQPVYIARPIFRGMDDPVPEAEWVFILDGDPAPVDLSGEHLRPLSSCGRRSSSKRRGDIDDAAVRRIVGSWFSDDEPPPTAAGDYPLTPITRRGEKALRAAYTRIQEATPGARRNCLNGASFTAGQLIASRDLPWRFTTGKRIGDLLLDAALRMRHNDKYDRHRLREIIATGLTDGGLQPQERKRPAP
jgi:hypothetical protein